MQFNPHGPESLVRHVIVKLRQKTPEQDILGWLQDERGYEPEDARRMLTLAHRVKNRITGIKSLLMLAASLVAMVVSGALFLFRRGDASIGYGWMLIISVGVLSAAVFAFSLAQVRRWRRDHQR